MFGTQTDTEVIAHLVHAHWHGDGGGDLLRAVQLAVAEFHGAYAIAVISTREPRTRRSARGRAARWSSGIGDDDHFLASDASALLSGHAARRVPRRRRRRRRAPRVVRDLRCAAGSASSATVVDVPRQRRRGRARTVPHFMQKEIFEQPRAVADTLEGVARHRRRRCSAPRPPRSCRDVDSRADPRLRHELLLEPRRQAVDRNARAAFRCTVEIASEYRYRDSVPHPKALVVVVSQSGETADTLAALKHAKSLGHAHTLAICNVATSSMVRQTELTFLTRAGTEIGVASTKAFTTQLVAQFLLALTLAKLRGRLSAGRGGAVARRRCATCRRRIQGALALEPHLIGVGAGVREEAARAVPRPRPALSDRARRRAEAEGNLVHPRRGVSGRRAEARAAGAGRRRDAGGRDRAQRRAARKAQVEPAGSARARRRALRRRRSRQPASPPATAST